MTSHMIIFDTQIKPSTNLEFMRWMGDFFLERRPDKLIHIGDHWDMPSLSRYDTGLSAVGKNYQNDIESGIEAWRVFFRPYWEYVKHRKSQKKGYWKPEMHFLMGNHEERILKFVNDNPLLQEKVSYDDLKLDRLGFTWYNFLQPLKLDGIQYIHYVKNKNSNYPKASAKATIEQTFMSTIQGHKPGLDIYTVWNDRTECNAWSIINGASYVEDQKYREGGGNDHWRGIAYLNNVRDGDFSPEFISMEDLKNVYG